MRSTRLRRIGALFAGALLVGCVPTVGHRTLDADRLVSDASPRLACAWRRAPVVDGRPDSERLGRLGIHAFDVEDAPAMVDALLAPLGWAPADTDAPEVRITLKRLYMGQNQVTKVPVVVYDVAVPGRPSWLLRAQPANSNWAGTENEAHAGYRRAFATANTMLVAHLDAACGSARPR